MSFEIKSAELPLNGYTLVLRAPTLHQHKAVVEAFGAIKPEAVMGAVQPIIDAAKTDADGAVTTALLKSVPAIAGALRAQLLDTGVDLMFRAAAICLDTRANHRRLRAPCPDEDFDSAKIADFEPGPDGSTYLECESLRAWVRQSLTIDAAFWCLTTSISLGGYGDLGKAVASAVLGGLRTAVSAIPAPPKASPTTAPITA